MEASGTKRGTYSFWIKWFYELNLKKRTAFTLDCMLWMHEVSLSVMSQTSCRTKSTKSKSCLHTLMVMWKRSCQHGASLHPRRISWRASRWAESLSADLADVISATLTPSLLPPSLTASCDSPALWSIPSEGLMMGPSCVREGAGLPLMWSAQQRASLENRRPRWLRWPVACSRTAPALDILGSDYKPAARSREA